MKDLSKKTDTRLQSGCIPYRYNNGIIEVLLVQSTRAGNWTIPSGGLEPNHTAEQNAMKEAYEEAGVSGKLTHVLGTYSFKKKGKEQVVMIYAMRVTTTHAKFPEQKSRGQTWMPLKQAVKEVNRGGVLLKRFQKDIKSTLADAS